MTTEYHYSHEDLASIWSRLMELFGASMARRFGKAMPGVWKEKIRALHPSQVRHAIEQLVESGEDHPPSLPKFLKLARSLKLQQQSNQLPANQPPPLDQYDDIMRDVLMRVIRVNGGVSSQILPKIITAKARLAQQLRDMRADGKTKREVAESAYKGWMKMAEENPVTPEELQEARRQFRISRGLSTLTESTGGR